MTGVAVPRSSTHGFLFADLRDYSAFVEEHGDHAAAELLARYRTLVRSVIAREEGAEVRTEGDSFYVVFPSASRALFGGMALLAAAAESEPPLRVGVGVHAGETADTDEGPVGSAVNIAARVCSRAGAGELLVTETVRILTRTLVPYRFVPRGTPELKGIAEPIALFRVAEPDDPEAIAIEAARAQTPRPTAPSAVAGSEVAARPVRTIGLRWASVIAGLGVVAIIVAAGAIALQPRSTGPGQPTAAPSTALTSVAPASLTAAQADLISRLPLTIRASCLPSTTEATTIGAATSLTCGPVAGGGATAVSYNYYPRLSTLLATFDSTLTAHGIFGGDCRTASTATGEWNVGATFSGHLLCYRDPSGHARLIWTYESDQGQGILAEASRDDSDSQALYAWWDEIKAFVTH